MPSYLQAGQLGDANMRLNFQQQEYNRTQKANTALLGKLRPFLDCRDRKNVRQIDVNYYEFLQDFEKHEFYKRCLWMVHR